MLFNLMSKESYITLKAITLGEYGVGKTSFCNLLNRKKLGDFCFSLCAVLNNFYFIPV